MERVLFLTRISLLLLLQRKVEEELSSDKVPESEQDKMRHVFHLERDTSELKKAKVVEENGEQEAEPIRNGAECVSESEGADANSGSTESSGEGLVYQYKPGKSGLPACLNACMLCFSLFPPSFRMSKECCIGPKKRRVLMD